MLLFAIASVTPAVLISLAVLFGGAWPWLAVGYITVLVFSLDRLVAHEARNPDPEAEFPASEILLITLACLHFFILCMSIWAVGDPSGLSVLERGLVAVAAGLMFGQVAHPAAHELIHKPGRALRLLGRLIYASLLVGHHASAHLRVHHVHVGSDADPNSARRGEGFYRYALRASRQSFRAGLAAENRLRAHAGKPAWTHPYALYMTVAAATFLLAAGLAGWGGIAALLGIAAYAQLQILMSDYVQHYGLRRHVMADGRLEPVGPQHSWNAPHWFSSALMLNAPRHSDHHVTPSRPFPALQLDPERMPYLPHPVPLMATIALVPPLWRRVMDPLCDRWSAPGWAPRPATARDIPPAVLARAKSGGTGAPGLPQSGHAQEPRDPRSVLPAAGAGAKPDERRRV